MTTGNHITSYTTGCAGATSTAWPPLSSPISTWPASRARDLEGIAFGQVGGGVQQQSLGMRPPGLGRNQRANGL
ncbi:hypothetical protein FHR56_002754 [Xanthomonas sacchari]|uniref:hypothetical protein n=1 Tax=unclassified Xanthomonas TaxID=2643310 RepID=UPI0016105818|nr:MULTISPECIES: hypothetical protein [unclassified Xanthomonas]MBB6367589.1 hypothetical protein [Xanthomonas sp. F10]